MNDEYNESESFLGGKGFYIALMLCVSIIAVSAWMLVNNSKEEEADALAETTSTPYVHQQVIEWSEPEPDHVEVIVPTTPEVTAVIEPEPADEPVQEVYVPVDEDTAPVVNLEKLSYIWPVIGEVELPYSMDALVFNVTMEDWRTHDGVDIAAAAGTAVVAAAAGSVAQVRQDDRLGTVVVIAHKDGYESTYASLQEEVAVSEGESVSAGQKIGTVGNTTLTESALGAHLHFSVKKDGAAVDPMEYLKQ